MTNPTAELSTLIRAVVLLAGAAIAACVAAEEATCPAGTLLEPYENVCATINDVRDEFIPPVQVTALSREADEDFPEPGTISIGVRYGAGYFSIAESARLHTRMFVYPDGLGTSLPHWVYTPATVRVDQSVEVVGMYRSWDDGKGLLGLYARPCSEEYPCPDGSTSNSWQYTRRYEEIPCNVTHSGDEHGHSNRTVHYAHHTDKLDDQDPAALENGRLPVELLQRRMGPDLGASVSLSARGLRCAGLRVLGVRPSSCSAASSTRTCRSSDMPTACSSTTACAAN